MIGKKATTGAERNGSIIGEKNAFIFGEAPKRIPKGIPITTTKIPAANTLATEYNVARRSGLLFVVCDQESLPKAEITSIGEGSRAGDTKPKIVTSDQITKTSKILTMP